MPRSAALSLILLLASGVSVTFAQEEEQAAESPSIPAVTSIQAGFLQHAEGEVWINDDPVEVESGRLAEMRDGGQLRTGEGRAELTLTAGSFLRVGRSSEVEMLQGGIISASFRLHSGELIADIASLLDDEPSSVTAGDVEVRFEKPGLYRIVLQPSGGTLVQTIEGKALHVHGAEQSAIKKGKSLLRTLDGAHEVGRAKDARDEPLFAWNKERRNLLQQAGVKTGQRSGESVVDRELRHMQTNRPVGTVVVGP